MTGNRDKKTYLNIILLTLLLTAITIVSVWNLNRKCGYYTDEGMTLYLANGHYTGAVTTVPRSDLMDFIHTFVLRDTFGETISNIASMLNEVLHAGNYSKKGTVEWYDAARSMLQGENCWMRGDELYEQLTTTAEKRFQYSQVLINQMLDVHPPLYYLLVHTVFSFFPERYSDYFLFFINIICLLGTCIVLFKTVEMIWCDPAAALLAVAVYGFGQGFQSCAVFFRMYAVETLLVMITLYYYLKMSQKDFDFERKDLFTLAFLAVLGFYTHYYYILYLFLLFCLTLCHLYRLKKPAGKYILSQVLAGFCSLVIWPLSLYHILFGYRGTEAFSRFRLKGLLNCLYRYASEYGRALFFGNLIVFLLFGVFTGFYMFYSLSHKEKSFHGWDLIILPAVFYSLVVARVAPTVSSRYIMCIFPIVSLVFAGMLASVTKALSSRTKLLLFAALGISYAVFSVLLTTPDYLYPERKDARLGISEDREKYNCLMVATEHYKGFPEALGLSAFHQVMVLDADDIDILTEKQPDDESREIVLYLDEKTEQDPVWEALSRIPCFTDREKTLIASDIPGFKAYLFH
ncbi:MAG: hypothetical protein K6G83_09040 [Lachnospiraceae bacterium]|nr:hypothetical protein [Lachnospiraceae bacterium]